MFPETPQYDKHKNGIALKAIPFSLFYQAFIFRIEDTESPFAFASAEFLRSD